LPLSDGKKAAEYVPVLEVAESKGNEEITKD